MATFQGSTQMPPFPGSQPGFSTEIPQPLGTSLTLGVSESTAWSTTLRVFSWKVVPASRCEGSGEGNGEGGKANTGRTAELAPIPGLEELVLGLSARGSERRPCRYELLPLPGGNPERIPSAPSPCDVRGRQGRKWEACVPPSHLLPSSYTCGKLVRVCAELVTLSLLAWQNCQGVLKWRPVHNPLFSLPARTVFMYISFSLIWWVFEDRYCILSPVSSMGPYTFKRAE